MELERPIGIAVLSILHWIGGVLGILWGLALLFLGALAATAIPDDVGAAVLLALAGLALLSIAVGVFDCAVGRGLWRLDKWAWWAALILTVLSALGVLANLALGAYASWPLLAIFGLLIDAIVFIYLLTPGVQEAFGVAASRPAAVPQRTTAHPRCLNPACGAEIRSTWRHCPRCLTPAGHQPVLPPVGQCSNRACGRPIQRGWSYCPHCLAPVGVA